MTQAMILCAGYGTRMKEYTREIPKPMLPIDNKPMIEYTIRHLERLGIRDLVINLHYMPDSITSYFENGRKFNVNIAYSYEESALGTAGAVKKAENLLKSENFLVIYGDIITNLNFNDMIKFHKDNQEAVGTIILHERSKSNSIVEMDENNRIYNFIERPNAEQLENKKQNWVNSSLYCFNRKIFDYIPPLNGEITDFPNHIFPKLIEKNKLYGFALNGYRCAIDSPERYFIVQSDYKKGLIFDF